MAETQDILYGVGSQTLFYDCPEGAPSSVTSVAVYENRDGDNSTAEVATTGSASVETSPNTTFDTASGASEANPKACRLADTQLLVIGRRYLARTQGVNKGASEWVELSENNEGLSTTATSKYPLHLDYTLSDTFESTRIQISVLDAWAASESNISGSYHPTGRYRVRWVYVVNSVTYVADTYFDLVRYPGSSGITPLDVVAHIPGWLDRLPTDSRALQGQDLIDAAYQQVKYRLIADGKADQLIRDTEVMGYLVALKADEVMAYGSYRAGGDPDQYAAARDRFYAEYSGVLGNASALLESRDDTGAGVVATSVGITVR